MKRVFACLCLSMAISGCLMGCSSSGKEDPSLAYSRLSSAIISSVRRNDIHGATLKSGKTDIFEIDVSKAPPVCMKDGVKMISVSMPATKDGYAETCYFCSKEGVFWYRMTEISSGKSRFSGPYPVEIQNIPIDQDQEKQELPP